MESKWKTMLTTRMANKNTIAPSPSMPESKAPATKPSPEALAVIEQKALTMVGADGQLTPEGLALYRNVQFAKKYE